MRKMDPMFDEAELGHASYLDFLRAHADVIDVHKPAVGDVTVAPKGRMAEGGEGRVAERAYAHPGYTPYVPSGGIPYQAPPPPPPAPMSPGERYRLWLRENNFRYVPSSDRHQIMRVMFDIFREAEDSSEVISLKEAKDRLHLWFEENRPSVPWESINSTVYHQFYTWCFFFDRSDEGDGRQLWDRRTTLQTDIHSADELISKCERGIVRKLWERDRSDVDPDALNEWLYDGDPTKRDYVADLIRSVTSAPGNFPVGRSV
jgi:hypothetical protein